eukprot:CAMPEP_0117453426 /NCGR_PEP_ID=MMETSP0759-20121206/10213_1 /TAXON_ID=63605 /ORGANISM="Percolomonas cosmopolitus, Strain WS" /LENGTH=824 /DNA_ID=CAMNT_0005246449 /DNA_START=344 /DNA_END=2820 /DNA_ORIENTATION=-
MDSPSPDATGSYYESTPLVQNYQINTLAANALESGNENDNHHGTSAKGTAAMTHPLSPQASLYLTISRYLLTIGLTILCLFLLSLLAHFGFQAAIDEGVYEAKVLVNGSEAYEQWVRSEEVSSGGAAAFSAGETFTAAAATTTTNVVTTFENIILLNLTNSHEILTSPSAIPLYQELPPITYRKNYRKFDISQSADNSTVTYREMVWYEYDEERSELEKDAVVTNLNPSYLAIMQQLGSESHLQKAMIGPVIEDIFAAILEVFPKMIFQAYRGDLLDASMVKVRSELEISMEEFCEYWSNGEPADDASSPWRNMTLRVFDNDTPDALNEPLDDALKHASTWIAASEGNVNAVALITSHFEGLTPQMLKRIFTWFKLSYDARVTWTWVRDTILHDGTPMTQGDLFSVADLGYYQWGQGGAIPLFPGQSVQSLLQLPGQPEIVFLSEFAFDIPTSRRLVHEQFFSQENTLQFLIHVAAQDYKSVMVQWGLERAQIDALAKYMMSIEKVFVGDALSTLFANHNGLISTRTAHEWLIEYNDPLLELLNVADLSKELMVLKSYVSEEDVRVRKPGYSVVSTGVKDLASTGNFIMDNGTSTLPWVRPDGSPSKCAALMGNQLDDDSTITIYFDDVLRPQDFVVQDHTSHEGISCLRFMLADYMSERNSTFHNNFLSQANLTILGAPIFIGKWRFYGSEPEWKERVHGLKECKHRVDCDTVLDVEPRTGLAMYERKRVQYNVHLPVNSTWLDTFHQDVSTNGTLFPIAMIEEAAEVTPELASRFKEQLTHAILLRDILYWLAVSLCLLSFVIGGTLTLGSFALKSRALGGK